ncbi:MAG TPA: glycosyltransferase family 4 protein [Thermoanaerobaculia bacterium]|jgi:glycosyltransferase involved in cell wall biosynthesis|nr:glycosyltransferase family 4 protein [Thermoanaerobaculia bacterium]
MTDRPRVLFVTQTHNVWGGMEQWLHNFTLWLQQNTDFDVRVALPHGRKFNDADVYLRAHSHMRPVILDVRVGTQSVRVRRIVEAIETVDPDLIVPIATGDVFEAVAEAKRRGAKVRYLQPVRALVGELLANVVDYWPSIDGVASISRLFDRFFREAFPTELDRVHYVRHGVRPAVVAHDRAAVLRVAFVGRIEPEMKRIFELVPLVEAIGSAKVEVHLYGQGPSEQELRARLATAPVPVTFHGYKTQDQLYRDAYPHIDVIVLFSAIGEGTPNAIVEAMQHGCVPVIARYQGQAGERFVVDGRNGFTFEPGDVATAAAKIRQLANDRQLLAELSTRARADVANDTAERMHRDWVAIFEKTLALPRKVPSAPAFSVQRAGRLDRLLSPNIADTLRQITHRHYPHADGWAEWPGTVPASPERVREVLAELERLDRYTDGE